MSEKLSKFGAGLGVAAALAAGCSPEAEPQDPTLSAEQAAYDQNQEALKTALAEALPSDFYNVEITNIQFGEEQPSSLPQHRFQSEELPNAPTLEVTFTQSAGELFDEFWEPKPVSETEQYELLWKDASVGAEYSAIDAEGQEWTAPLCSQTYGENCSHGTVDEQWRYGEHQVRYPEEPGDDSSTEYTLVFSLDPDSPHQEIDLRQVLSIGLDGADDFGLIGEGTLQEENPYYDNEGHTRRASELATIIIEPDANGELAIADVQYSA